MNYSTLFKVVAATAAVTVAIVVVSHLYSEFKDHEDEYKRETDAHAQKCWDELIKDFDEYYAQWINKVVSDYFKQRLIARMAVYNKYRHVKMTHAIYMQAMSELERIY